MTCYVDDLAEWGWKLRGRTIPSCHLFTDSLDLEELHRFAAQIGMKRAWFQPHKVAPHYDLTPGRRAHAVSLGAMEVGRRDASRLWRARREQIAALSNNSQAHGLEALGPESSDRGQQHRAALDPPETCGSHASTAPAVPRRRFV